MTDRIVLLVQPCQEDRDMYAEFLEYAGIRVVAVADARSALDVAPTADVIVTGLLLPGDMDGFTFVRRLRVDERTKHRPIIVLTACAWPRDRDRARAAGCDAFLPKPCPPGDLLREIRFQLAQRHRIEALRKVRVNAVKVRRTEQHTSEATHTRQFSRTNRRDQ